jgi:hypothetical protein
MREAGSRINAVWNVGNFKQTQRLRAMLDGAAFMRHPGESKEMGVMDASKLDAFRISAGTAAAAVISAVAFVAVWASPAAALACPTPGHSDINGDGHTRTR